MKFQVLANRCDHEDAAMNGGFDRSKSLQELEQQDWGEPTYHSSLVTTCHRLRRKPLNQFTVEDLRIMIGQQISLPFLVPLAVEMLESEPLVEGKYYPGDLLAMVLKVDEAFWTSHADSFQRVRRVVGRVKDSLSSLDEITGPTVQKLLEDAPRSWTSM
jgi:CDI immunity proteins